MAIEITCIDPERPDFGARVAGLDIAAGVSPEETQQIEAAIAGFGVLVFHHQQVTDDQQYAFSTGFGTMESATGDIADSTERRLPMHVNDISNLDQHGNVLAQDDRRRLFGLGNMLWHSDSSFKATPAKYSLLSARTIPHTDGNTEFADMRGAWDRLDPTTQALCQPLITRHSQLFSRGQLGFDDFTHEQRQRWAPVRQRLVRLHPLSRRTSLFLSSHIGEIEGWPVPEARMFLRDLAEHATQRDHVYAHRWQNNDLVMWDNQATMHRARRYDHKQVRDLRRTTVACDQPTVP